MKGIIFEAFPDLVEENQGNGTVAEVIEKHKRLHVFPGRIEAPFMLKF